MGGLLSRYTIDPDHPLVSKLSQLKQLNIEELAEYYTENYLSSPHLSFHEFDEIFSPYLNDIEN